MACKYCFYRDVTDRRSTGNLGIMTDETLELMIKNALSECETEVSFAFQGGEPTLAGLDFFKKVISLEKKHNTNGVKVHNVLQTNGLELDEGWADFFVENGFLVGVSLDGDKELHDTARLDRADKGTHSRIMQTLDLFRRKGVDFNILCVISSYVARYPEKVYNFFKKQGFNYLQFIPLLDPLEEKRGGNFWSLTPSRYASFLKKLFDLWYLDCKKHDGVSIRHFDNWLGLLMGFPPENCAMSGRCAVYFVVEADGSIYPCDFYVTDEWKMGNIADGKTFAELQRSDAATRFIAGSTTPENCSACKYYFLCRGGCRRDREPLAENAENFYCQAYTQFFDYATDRLREISLMEVHPYPFASN